jgi:hypothetical protein
VSRSDALVLGRLGQTSRIKGENGFGGLNRLI